MDTLMAVIASEPVGGVIICGLQLFENLDKRLSVNLRCVIIMHALGNGAAQMYYYLWCTLVVQGGVNSM